MLSVDVEGPNCRSVSRGLSADLVEGGEAVESVERSILNAFGRDRSRDLLELHRKGANAAAHQLRYRRQLHQEGGADEVEHGRFGD